MTAKPADPARTLRPASRAGRALRARAVGRPGVAAGWPVRATSCKHCGIVLPGALMLASMMLTTSAVWLEASIAQMRHAANVHEHLRAAHAADNALALCAEALRAGIAPVLLTRSGEPPQWSRPVAFDGPGAYEPAPSWPGSARAPQCVIETGLVEGSADTRTYWITSRGFGVNEAVQARAQLMIVRDEKREAREGGEGREGRERSAWRRIVTDAEAGST